MTNLKPCRNCGCDQIHTEESPQQLAGWRARCYCRNCDTAGPRGVSSDVNLAIRASYERWNAAQEVTSDRLDKMATAIHQELTENPDVTRTRCKALARVAAYAMVHHND